MDGIVVRENIFSSREHIVLITKTNPSVAIYTLDEVWGQDKTRTNCIHNGIVR